MPPLAGSWLNDQSESARTNPRTVSHGQRLAPVPDVDRGESQHPLDKVVGETDDFVQRSVDREIAGQHRDVD